MPLSVPDIARCGLTAARDPLCLAVLATLALGSAHAQPAASPRVLDTETLNALRWRPIGPANMMGRVADVEGIPSPSKTFYVASAAGGIYKTMNNGTTFKSIFDDQRCISMGDLAIAPSDTNVVYAGTGEPNSRNSMSPGCGVFKTTDGGKSWSFIGLPGSEHIGRIIVDPRDANVAYVAALGPAWRTGGERGLYKTTDGGKNWTCIKCIDDKTGFVDVEFDPSNPDVLWAASYQRIRGPYFLNSGGPGSGLWKSTDAGKTWTAVTGGGLPETVKGRIEIAIAASNPKVMYLMLEADTVSPKAKDAAAKPQTRPSGLYRSADGGATWTKTNSENVRPFYYSQVRVDTKNPDRVYWSSTPVKVSDDGGKTARNATNGIHVDHHAMWIDPNDPMHIVVGNDGGIATTWDRGGTWDFQNVFPIGQFYNVSFDMAVPYNVCGGAQDNGSWCGPSRRKSGGITNAMWFTYAGGDGFVSANDPRDPNIVYGESQGGNMSRVNVATGDRTSLVKPSWLPKYRQFEDSIIIERADTTRPETPAQKKRLADLRARQKSDSTENDLRWNWNTPFFLSPHNPDVFYAAANRVMKSMSRGDNLFPISPDLTTKNAEGIRVATKVTGGITPDITGAEMFSTIVSLNESPVKAGMLFAGTDDGNVWLSRTDGATWDNVSGRFAGVPAGTYVSRIEPSHFDTETFFVTFDNHRRGDFTPYVYMTTDGGRTFASIAANLPKGGPDFVHVIREDRVNRDLLFVGTDVGAYVSLDRGASWQKFMTGLGTVPVHDLQIHPRDRELIAATHGRAFWIVDIAPLQEMTATVAAKPTHVFSPRTAYQHGERIYGGESPGHKLWSAPSPAYGAEVAYRIASGTSVTGPVRVAITDAKGDTLRAMTGPTSPGVHRLVWDMRGKAAAQPALTPSGIRDSVKTFVRTTQILDSLEKANTMPKPMLDRVRGAMLGGPQGMQNLMASMGGGPGGGGGGAANRAVPPVGYPRFVDRPGESGGGGPGGGAPAAAPRGEGAQGEGAAPEMDMGAMSNIFGAFREVMGGRGGGFIGGRGGAAPLVPTGTYLAHVTINGQTTRVPIRVERLSGGEGGGSFFGADDSDEEALFARFVRLVMGER